MNQPCPNCGYCPTCKRASPPALPVWSNPYPTYWPWWQQPYRWGTTILTSSTDKLNQAMGGQRSGMTGGVTMNAARALT